MEKQAGIFGNGEESLVGGQTESGNFHAKAHQDNYEKAMSKGAFNVLYKRLDKIEESLETTEKYQAYEREKEVQYRELQTSLSSNIFNMTVLEIILVIGSAAFSVYSLRKFFVKRHIF